MIKIGTMDDLTAQNVKEAFGINFQQYCLRRKILLKSDGQNNFVAPNSDVLTKCICAIDDFRKKKNTELLKFQKYASHKNSMNCNFSYCMQRLRKGNKSKKKKEKIRMKKTATAYLMNLQVYVHLCNTSQILPTYKRSGRHILNVFQSGSELYEFIIKEHMKELIIHDYEAASPLISLLLEQFQKQHNKFKYIKVLKQLAYKQKSNKDKKCLYQINMEQMKSFFNLIFVKVVSLKMFGKLQNIKKIKKALFKLLDMPRFTYFDLVPVINKLDIYSIIWLNNIKDDEQKWLILTKFVKWFFDQFLIKILYLCFHVTSVSFANHERLYIPRFIWNRIQRNFIKKRVQLRTLQSDVKCNEWSPPIGTYNLFPKYSNVRPILKPQCQEKDKKHLYTVLKFLKQLHATNYGSKSFQEKWKTILKWKESSNVKQLYFMSCDVMDAFGSIIQEKLFEIIQQLCKELPEVLLLKYYIVQSKKFRDEVVCYKQYFSDPHLRLPFSHGTLYAYPNVPLCQWIKKSWLLERISKQIFYQRVKISDKKYIITRGIAQGTMLSPILSDIYYNFILHEEMAAFLKAGEVIKYMDDILYVTPDKTSATRFLEQTMKGIPQYNCFFQTTKTQSNVACAGTTVANDIVYIGYKINCATLAIEPKEPNTDLRYLVSFANKYKLPPLQFLKQRLNNIAALKITKFILDKTVNNDATIIRILEEKCLIQAKRASILIKQLFHPVKDNIHDILKIIKYTNKRIASYIIKCLTFHNKMEPSNMYMWNSRILFILWRSYKEVFKEDKTLSQCVHFFINKLY